MSDSNSTTDIFTLRAETENTVRVALTTVQATISNAVANGLYPDGLTMTLENIKNVTDYSLTVLANTDATASNSNVVTSNASAS